MFAQETPFITENGKNSDYGWQITDLQSLYNDGYISSETLGEYDNRQTLRVVLDNNGQGENGFYISPGGEYDLKLIVTKVISSLSDLDDRMEDVCEVLVYKDNFNRRMAYLEEANIANTRNMQLVGVYPGDSKDKDFSDTTNRVFILPPTGEITPSVGITITCASILAIIAVIAILRRKRNTKKK